MYMQYLPAVIGVRATLFSQISVCGLENLGNCVCAALFLCFHLPKFSLSFVSYAMDWEPRDGRVRVMLGKSGKVICTLKVDPLYSEGRGHVTFLGVEGCSDKHHLQKLPVKSPLTVSCTSSLCQTKIQTLTITDPLHFLGSPGLHL